MLKPMTGIALALGVAVAALACACSDVDSPLGQKLNPGNRVSAGQTLHTDGGLNLVVPSGASVTFTGGAPAGFVSARSAGFWGSCLELSLPGTWTAQFVSARSDPRPTLARHHFDRKARSPDGASELWVPAGAPPLTVTAVVVTHLRSRPWAAVFVYVPAGSGASRNGQSLARQVWESLSVSGTAPIASFR